MVMALPSATACHRLAGVIAACVLGSLSLAPSAHADAIKIGAPIPITGPYSSDGEVMDKGERLAIDELNAQGGLLGQKLEYSVFDIGDLTPDKLQAAATDLVERKNVQVLINGYGGMGPDIPAFCPYPIPYINNDATSNVVELEDKQKCKNIFMGSDVDINYGRITFQQLMALGHQFPNKKLAIIAGPYDWELNTTKGAREAAEKLGWEVVVDEQVPYDTKEWGGILSKIRDANPSLIYLELLDPASVNAMISQFHDNPSKQALLYAGYTVSVPAFGEIVKTGAADGVLGMTLSAQRPDDKGRAFAEKWKQKYNEEPPFSVAAQIYDEVMMWAAAVKKAGSATDYKAITDALRNTAYDGITGTVKFNDQQYVTSSDDTVPTQLLQVQGNEVKQVAIGTKKNVEFKAPPWIK
jgi:branched-chain amino acid transport system substrate-binding protein